MFIWYPAHPSLIAHIQSNTINRSKRFARLYRLDFHCTSSLIHASCALCDGMFSCIFLRSVDSLTCCTLYIVPKRSPELQILVQRSEWRLTCFVLMSPFFKAKRSWLRNRSSFISWRKPINGVSKALVILTIQCKPIAYPGRGTLERGRARRKRCILHELLIWRAVNMRGDEVLGFWQSTHHSQFWIGYTGSKRIQGLSGWSKLPVRACSFPQWPVYSLWRRSQYFGDYRGMI